MKFIIPPLARKRGATDSERQAMRKARLTKAGGRRVPLNLPQQSMLDLRTIQLREGLTGKGAQTAAVVTALHHYARRKLDRLD